MAAEPQGGGREVATARGRISGRRMAGITAALLGLVAAVALALHLDRLLVWHRVREEFVLVTLSSAAGRAELRHRQTGLVMVYLPGGGDVEPFLISKHEVSQEVWTSVMPGNASYHAGPRLPVTNVSWGDASGFCERVGLSLPASVEWEHAFGDGGERGGAYAPSGLVPVEEAPGNRFGIRGLRGNVAEWCEDRVTRSDAVNKTATTSNEKLPLSVRGGSWLDAAASAGAEPHRSARWVTDSSWSLGFRPVYRLGRRE